MQISGNIPPKSNAQYAGDMPSVITRVRSRDEAKALPRGAVVGDLHGGVTFTDEVAAVLESRSFTGWRESEAGWTVICLHR